MILREKLQSTPTPSIQMVVPSPQVTVLATNVIVVGYSMLAYAITDFGHPYTARSEEGDTLQLARYGVWRVEKTELVQAVETSDDLAYLQQKYGEHTPVLLLPSGGVKKVESSLTFPGVRIAYELSLNQIDNFRLWAKYLRDAVDEVVSHFDAYAATDDGGRATEGDFYP